MNSIIKSFSEHGTFVQPVSLDYILSKEDPTEFTSFLTKSLKEYMNRWPDPGDLGPISTLW